MTRDEWEAGVDPGRMLRWLGPHADRRKLRLLACGGCRLDWRSLHDPASRRAVASTEALADGEATATALRADAVVAARVRKEARFGGRGDPDRARANRTLSAVYHTTRPWGQRADPAGEAEAALLALPDDLHPAAAGLVRCVFGDPSRRPTFSPSWATLAARELAAGIYAGREFDRLPLLADALERAGCDRPDLLDYLRGGGGHARGCWPVDLVLGKAVADPVPPGASARWW